MIGPSTLDRIAGLLASHGYVYTCEDDLQRAIAEILDREGIDYERESRGAAGRIDFRVGGVGLEVKCAGALADTLRQLSRYAVSGDYPGGLILATSLRRLARLPDEIAGTPVRAVVMETTL